MFGAAGQLHCVVKIFKRQTLDRDRFADSIECVIGDDACLYAVRAIQQNAGLAIEKQQTTRLGLAENSAVVASYSKHCAAPKSNPFLNSVSPSLTANTVRASKFILIPRMMGSVLLLNSTSTVP